MSDKMKIEVIYRLRDMEYWIVSIFKAKKPKKKRCNYKNTIDFCIFLQNHQAKQQIQESNKLDFGCNSQMYLNLIIVLVQFYHIRQTLQSFLQLYSRIKMKRSSRLTQIRTSIKSFKIINEKSQMLEDKYRRTLKQINHFESCDSENTTSKKQLSHSNSVTLQDQVEDSRYSCYNDFSQKYQLLEKLGEGANACVYKCFYKPNGRFYAAKKFRIEEEHIMELKKNFIDMKELNHGSICKYRALYFDKNQRFAFLIMEYLPFQSLAEYNIKSEDQLRELVKKIIEAITYIHNRNMCHRDIKPENILYNQRERTIKIIDFGISKKTFLRGVRRDLLTIIGTPNYLAPQVYNGGGYDERIDLWALGITIYKMISGYTPFQSEYHSDFVANILKGEVKFDDKIWSGYSPFAKLFVNSLLKPKQQRLSLQQAGKHLWLESEGLARVKFKKTFSSEISLHENFHYELNHNVKNASCREQGTKLIDENKKLYRKISRMNDKNYELQDSDDEWSVVRPKTAGCNMNIPQNAFASFSSFMDYSFDSFIGQK